MGVKFKDIKKLIYIYGYPDRDYDMKRHALLISLHRDPYDMFNVFCISITTKAFTDVLEVAKNYQIETNFNISRKQAIQIDMCKENWIKLISKEYVNVLKNLDKCVAEN